MISPNCNPAVIGATKRAEMFSMPAYFTPTEAFVAIDAGADALKLFPAEIAGPQGLKAIRAVLPRDFPVLPVGGITPETMAPDLVAGVSGFGMGSSLYQPGRSTIELAERARRLAHAYRAARAQ